MSLAGISYKYDILWRTYLSLLRGCVKLKLVTRGSYEAGLTQPLRDKFPLPSYAVGRDPIERLRFLAPGTGTREGGDKTQPFNWIHSSLFTARPRWTVRVESMPRLVLLWFHVRNRPTSTKAIMIKWGSKVPKFFLLDRERLREYATPFTPQI